MWATRPSSGLSSRGGRRRKGDEGGEESSERSDGHWALDISQLHWNKLVLLYRNSLDFSPSRELDFRRSTSAVVSLNRAPPPALPQVPAPYTRCPALPPRNG